MIFWGLATRGLGLYAANHPNETFFLPRPVFQTILFFVYGTSGKYLEDFAIGMLISMCYVYSRQAAADSALSKSLYKASRWLWGTGILWLIVVSLWHYDNWFHKDASLFFFDPVSPAYYLLGEISLSIGFGLCITALLFGPAYLRWPLELKPLRWIGMISYSLYIWHLPMLAYWMHLLKPLQQQGMRNAFLYALLWFCAIFLIIPFSFMVYKWIEEPWIRLSSKLSQRGKKGQAAAKTW